MRLTTTSLRRTLTLACVLPFLQGCPSPQATRIGAVLPLTGEHQLYGESIRNGVELAFEEVLKNEATGDWVLTVRDSASDPGTSASLVEELYDGEVAAVIGGATTDEALASVPIADRFGRVLLSPSASSEQLTGASRNFYRVFISDGREGGMMAQFAVQDLRASTAVVVTGESLYARGIKDVFEERFADLGGEISDAIEFPGKDGDQAGPIERAVALDPDTVYLAGYADEVADMIRGLRQRRFDGTIMTTAAFATPVAIERAGSAADGVFLTQPEFDSASELPEVNRFVNLYTERYGHPPDLYAAHGFDAVKVLAAGILQVEGDTGEVWSGLRALREFQGVTGVLQFDERGDVQRFPRVYRIRDGALVDYKKEREIRAARLRQQREELIRRMREIERKAAAAKG